MQVTGQRIMFDMRMQIYSHLQRLDLRDYDRNPVGRLMTRVTTDVDTLNELFSAGVVAIFGDVFTLVGHHGRADLARLAPGHRRLRRAADHRAGHAVVPPERPRVVPDGAPVDRAHQCVPAGEHHRAWPRCSCSVARAGTSPRFDDINQKHRDANIESIFYYAVFYPAIEVVSALAAAMIVWFGGGWVLQGTLTLGALVAFLQYSQRFFRPIQDMSEKFNILQSAMASSERIFKLLDTPIAVAPPAEPRRLASGTRGHIVFEHVWFAYNGDDYVLRDVSFEVVPGQRVGIVGATGAGKSTIINLLLRFYDVSKGRILVDGVDVRELPFEDLRRLFGLVLQDVHLFSGTIAGNIRLGHGEISDERDPAGGDGRARAPVHLAPREGVRRAGRGARRRRCRSARSSCCPSRARWPSIRAC